MTISPPSAAPTAIPTEIIVIWSKPEVIGQSRSFTSILTVKVISEKALIALYILSLAEFEPITHKWEPSNSQPHPLTTQSLRSIQCI